MKVTELGGSCPFLQGKTAAVPKGRFVKGLTIAIVAASLAGCGASGAVPSQVSSRATESPQQTQILLYVSDAGTNRVDYLAYPEGTRRGMLSGFGGVQGLCADRAGDIYAVDVHKSEVLVYKHDAKQPTQILYDQGFYPSGCAVDPKTGRLAVALDAESSGQGVVAVFTHATGRPVYYSGNGVYTPAFCGFDNKGNLFVDGLTKEGSFAFSEFPFGYNGFFNVTLNKSISVPGAVQWDGHYLAVGDQGVGSAGSTIYRFAIGASGGTSQGTVALGGSTHVTQFWVYREHVIGPNSGSSPSVMIWNYPAGGQPVKTFTGFTDPVGAALSQV
jgi:hypothetical protein